MALKKWCSLVVVSAGQKHLHLWVEFHGIGKIGHHICSCSRPLRRDLFGYLVLPVPAEMVGFPQQIMIGLVAGIVKIVGARTDKRSPSERVQWC